MEKFGTLVLNVGGPGSAVRREDMDGRSFTVVETAILPREGVVSGSLGAVFYPEEDNVRAVPVWNHRPLVVNHPKDSDGKHTTGCSAEVLRTRAIGFTLNTRIDDKLRTESWIDEVKANRVDRRILVNLNAGRPVEVSTGLFARYDEEVGEYDGKPYSIVARNHAPDHLAVLPDELGAYSVKEGGGMLVVNAGREPEATTLALNRTTAFLLKEAGGSILDNQLSFDAKARAISDLLSEKYGKSTKYWDGYLVSVYDGYAVFSNPDQGGDSSALYKIGYTASGDSVSLTGDSQKVVRKVEYVANAGSDPAVVGNTKPEAVMAFDKEKHLATLIGDGGYAEGDRPWLSALPDENLEKVRPVPKVAANAGGSTTTTTTTTTAAPVTNSSVTKVPTIDEILANSDPVEAELWREGRAAVVAERQGLINTILANEAGKGVGDAKWLSEQPLARLRAMAKMAKRAPTFDLGAGVNYSDPITTNSAAPGHMSRPRLTADKDFARNGRNN